MHRICQPSRSVPVLHNTSSDAPDYPNDRPSLLAGLPAEANLLAAQAISAGVPPKCIVIEDQAQNSIENALNCLPVVQKSDISHIVLVTSDYHMPRCRLLFELVLQGTGIELSWAEVSCLPHLAKQ